ncbi:MAG: ATP-binding cassette domain-containing protein [Sphingobacteriaceae bacterium]|nr:MAG: ATP-binding cassette domain-containing protein [Sphingobacteriaceae bacterium]
MAQPLFNLQHITVRSITHTIFTNLNFAVNKGENWALIGESGSGKSALLHTIAGNLSVTNGEVIYNFDDVADGESYRKRIGLVEPRHHFRNLSNTTDFYYQQRFNSFDSEDALTVEQYLSTIPHADKVYWTYDKTVATLNLKHLLGKQLIKLSNGETKRLMLAAALLKNAQLLLLDNPLTGLDVQTRQEFNGIIKEITAAGTTIVMATSPYEVPEAITHIALLKNGSIMQTLTKDQYSPELMVDKGDDQIDNEELQLLLAHQAQTPYNTIVGMRKVHIQYGDIVILDDINWSVKAGDRWALLGHNGAGKSTLLSLINGDNPQAYANDIVLFDKKRGTGESIWDIKKKIGFVSPELHQYFPTDNSCLQVIESGYYDTLGLFRKSSPAKAEIALRWMKALEIDKYARTLLKNIPASVQRLCLLARALIKNPDLLIFDEPCQGMDTHQQQHFKKLIDTICSMSKVTLIYVTHYQHEIPDSVDKVLKLEKGRVVE